MGSGKFEYSHFHLSQEERKRENFYSAVPGFLSWAFLIGLVLLSYIRPLYGAVFIIAFYVYWFFRLFYMTLFMVIAYGVLSVDENSDWIDLCHLIEKGDAGLKELRETYRKERKGAGDWKRWIRYKKQKRELKKALKLGGHFPKVESIYHVVIIATSTEGRDVIEPGIQALSESRFPSERILPVLAVEERAGQKQIEMAEELKKEYADRFLDFLVAVHPFDIAGEAKVKGANVSFAGRQTEEFLKKKKIPLENVIASCFDADTVPSPQYFAALTFHFMRNPNRLRASYQPVPVYHNNIWEAPGFARVLEMGSSFFQLVEATNPEKLVTFSSHSMSFKALVEIGYWPVDLISDDSAIFWKALIHYDGDYRVVPMYVTVSMDVAMSTSFWKSLGNTYQQKRRWAWGVENFPIVARAFVKNKKISLLRKARYLFKLLEMHFSWATLGFVVTFLGWLPALFAGREYSTSVLYYNSARINGLIFNMAAAFLLVMVILSFFMLPKKKTDNPVLKRVIFALEWLLVPLVFTFLSTLPALDAQTRLLRGKAMDFHITDKARKR